MRLDWIAMPGSVVPERRLVLALSGLAVVLALSGHLRRPPSATPPRIAPEAVEPWMADALPGIGPVHRDSATAAIRARDWAQLPKASRTLAREVFSD